MLGAGLARNLKAQPGASLTLLAGTTEGAMNALDVTVVGVVATGVPEIDQRLVYTDVATAQRLLVTDRVSSLGIFLDRMEATLPARDRLGATLPGLALRTWEEQAPFYRSVRALYNRIFGALGLIIGVIVVVVVANAMAMSVIERTREIGTLRSLGTRPGQLLQTLAMEGLLLGAAAVSLAGHPLVQGERRLHLVWMLEGRHTLRDGKLGRVEAIHGRCLLTAFVRGGLFAALALLAMAAVWLPLYAHLPHALGFGFAWLPWLAAALGLGAVFERYGARRHWGWLGAGLGAGWLLGALT